MTPEYEVVKSELEHARKSIPRRKPAPQTIFPSRKSTRIESEFSKRNYEVQEEIDDVPYHIPSRNSRPRVITETKFEAVNAPAKTSLFEPVEPTVLPVEDLIKAFGSALESLSKDGESQEEFILPAESPDLGTAFAINEIVSSTEGKGGVNFVGDFEEIPVRVSNDDAILKSSIPNAIPKGTSRSSTSGISRGSTRNESPSIGSPSSVSRVNPSSKNQSGRSSTNLSRGNPSSVSGRNSNGSSRGNLNSIPKSTSGSNSRHKPSRLPASISSPVSEIIEEVTKSESELRKEAVRKQTGESLSNPQVAIYNARNAESVRAQAVRPSARAKALARTSTASPVTTRSRNRTRPPKIDSDDFQVRILLI